MFLPRLGYCFAIIILHLFTPLVSYASDYVGISTPHFVFYFHSQDERLMRSLIDQAEGLRREVVEDLGIDFEERTKVYLAPSSRKFQEIQPKGKVPSWAVGVAYPSLNLIIIKSPRATTRGHMDLRKVFKHEFSHIALGRAFEGREKVPRWLDEGLAMYESREWDLSRVSTMTRAVLTDSLIPLSEITGSFPQEVDRAGLAYSESFYLISFLISRYGKESFHRFIKEYSGSKGLKEVLMGVYGIRLEELEKRWRNYLKLRFSWIPIVTSTTTLWFLVTIVFILGYLRRRKANRLKFEEWEREEQEE
ncbi:MAG: hypothetical protein HWN70_09225 [Desulfobacterales bacterium]|nr:hypothetical protein [Desulfobacterales bacterium]